FFSYYGYHRDLHSFPTRRSSDLHARRAPGSTAPRGVKPHGLPYVPSPLFYDGRVYIIRDGGMMSSFDVKTGKAFYLQERLEAADKYYASPIAGDGRIYLASVPGKLTGVKAGGDK